VVELPGCPVSASVSSWQLAADRYSNRLCMLRGSTVLGRVCLCCIVTFYKDDLINLMII
jgi:hypothetical protein